MYCLCLKYEYIWLHWGGNEPQSLNNGTCAVSLNAFCACSLKCLNSLFYRAVTSQGSSTLSSTTKLSIQSLTASLSAWAHGRPGEKPQNCIHHKLMKKPRLHTLASVCQLEMTPPVFGAYIDSGVFTHIHAPWLCVVYKLTHYLISFYFRCK